MNSPLPPVVATQSGQIVLLLGLLFLLSQLKTKTEQAGMERFGNGSLAVSGRNSVAPLWVLSLSRFMLTNTELHIAKIERRHAR